MAAQSIPFKLFQTAGLESKNRSLRFDLNAMADFESITGMGLAQLMQTNAVFAATRALLWAGLKHQDRGLTIQVAGSLIQDYMNKVSEIDETREGLKEVLQICIDACITQKAVPGLKKEEEIDDQDKDAAAKAADAKNG